MKAHLETYLFLILMLASPSAMPQEKELLQEELIQDDLGNVTDDFQENFFEALKQKAIENHEKAINSLMKCLAIDPQPVVYFELGKNYNALERFSEASNYLEKARKAEPGNEAVLTELYNTYYQDHQFDKALPVVEDLQKINPLFTEDLANLYILDEQYDKALGLLNSLDAKWGESDYREGLRRQIYARTGNVDARVQELEQKIAENPKDEENYLNLVFVYIETGDKEKAFEIAKELLEKDPDSEIVHLALYKFYLEKQNIDDAVNSIRIIFEGSTIEEEAKYQVLSDFLLFMGTTPGIGEELMEIVEVFSEEEANTKVYAQLGNFFMERENKEKALEYFEKGMQAGNMNFEVLIKTILLQLEFDKFEDAKLLSGNAIEDYPSQPLLYLIHGTALNRTGAYREAVEILTFGLDFVIDDQEMEADFYVQLSFAHNRLNEAVKASEYESKAAKLKTENVNE